MAKTKEEQQLMQLEYLIKEFYSGAEVFLVDPVEEIIHFFVNRDSYQLRVDRENEEIQFYCIEEGCVDEDWEYTDNKSFDEVNRINEVAFL